MRKKRDIVVSARVRSDSLAHLLIWMRTQGVTPTSTSAIMDECIEILADNIPGERPSTTEALAILSEIGLRPRTYQRQHLALNIEQDVPALQIPKDSITQRFERDAEKAKKLYDLLRTVPLEELNDE